MPASGRLRNEFRRTAEEASTDAAHRVVSDVGQDVGVDAQGVVDAGATEVSCRTFGFSPLSSVAQGAERFHAQGVSRWLLRR